MLDKLKANNAMIVQYRKAIADLIKANEEIIAVVDHEVATSRQLASAGA